MRVKLSEREKKIRLIALIVIGVVLIGGYVYVRYCSWYNRAAYRGEISVAKAHMRSLASAIESYMLDNAFYPPHTFEPEYKAYADIPVDIPTFDIRCSLTTPVAYIGTFPASEIAYWSRGDAFILVYGGRNGDFDVDFRSLENKVSLQREASTTAKSVVVYNYFMNHQYDPSNGTESSGDVYQHGGWFTHWFTSTPLESE